MVAITRDVATGLSRQCSTDSKSVGLLLFALRRSLAREAINEELYDDLEAVLGEYAAPDPDRIGDLAARFRTAMMNSAARQKADVTMTLRVYTMSREGVVTSDRGTVATVFGGHEKPPRGCWAWPPCQCPGAAPDRR